MKKRSKREENKRRQKRRRVKKLRNQARRVHRNQLIKMRRS